MNILYEKFLKLSSAHGGRSCCYDLMEKIKSQLIKSRTQHNKTTCHTLYEGTHLTSCACIHEKNEMERLIN